ncbi:MAG: 2-amino-4-hydroxy-6-hydroxymethyldihydropteridine diphosphokinase [Candidatus Koribacter versatilis]|uniref:2-amino-4-hydroxy-6-hydroxymethyldihydropteridine pyrophosphokinase n=1 Tax=Candidatus Korobacter versatilis TaxID=658062 RepID=A0A932EQS1_9BACT|nr:2-amino-4-hydroxy-6-hydroxymethyldihydropteridine diphosphokinase [Candidatus Koribacter versatilis]
MKKLVYLGLGSDLGDRRANLDAAIGRIAELGVIKAQSSFYETEPMEMAQQSGAPQWFLNCALVLETELMPKQLLGRLLEIERGLGRKRPRGAAAEVKTPRTIDLDILMFGSSVVEAPGLVIPHPAMHLRRFVLEPLAEIAADVRHPVFKRSVREMRDALPKDSGAVKKLAQ